MGNRETFCYDRIGGHDKLVISSQNRQTSRLWLLQESFAYVIFWDTNTFDQTNN